MAKNNEQATIVHRCDRHN